jgi:hypothetical protein
MVGLIILTLLMTALYQTFSQSQQSAKEIMANQQINDDFDLILQKITEDIRESNFVDAYPPILTKAELATYKTDDPRNYLLFMKVIYDFTKDPIDLPAGTYNYTQNRIKYFLVREDDSDPGSPFILYREMLPFDNKRKPIDSEIVITEMLSGIEECLFYRVKDSDSSRYGNVYIKLKMTRNDKEGSSDEKYTNETIISVKERGAMPQ